jgi:hypothetical protein
MKTKAILLASIALLAILAVNLVSATDIVSGNMVVSFDDIVLSDSTELSVDSGSMVPVKVVFKALEDEEDVRVKVWIEGYRTDISAKTERFDTKEDVVYSKNLQLSIPTDLEETSEKFTLHVSISANNKYDTESYEIRMQKNGYALRVLSVDSSLQANQGDIVPFMIVVENSGSSKLRNSYVSVSIPALGISSQGYLGHLVSQESSDSDAYDAIQKVVYLRIPATADSGVYDVVVQAYNKETSTAVNKAIKIGSANSATTALVVSEQTSDNSAYIIALTVVLAIVFVVLFIVLIVLLTKKSAPMEEAETSYY